MNENELEWFKSHLFTRRKVVKIQNHTSNELPLRVGIPQGSALGSLLFLVLVNDLSTCINRSEGNYFADDSMIHSEVSGYAELLHNLQSDTAHIGKCFKQNRLTANVEKSESMINGTSRRLGCVPDIDIVVSQPLFRPFYIHLSSHHRQ